MWRKLACQILSKTLDIPSAIAEVAPDLLKTQAIWSNTTARRSSVGWEIILEIKKSSISLGDQQSYC